MKIMEGIGINKIKSYTDAFAWLLNNPNKKLCYNNIHGRWIITAEFKPHSADLCGISHDFVTIDEASKVEVNK